MNKFRFFAAICCAALLFAACEKNDEPANGHEYVDLGLSVKWATCNLGANKPEQEGYLYAWGETQTKERFCEDNYKWGKYQCVQVYRCTNCTSYVDCQYIEECSMKYTKYCCNSKNGYCYNSEYEKDGFVDNKSVLEKEDDAACVQWGGKWRMPTVEEWEELIENCIWTWTTKNGIVGYNVKSKQNSNFIFIPINTYSEDCNEIGREEEGWYWSKSSDVDDGSFFLTFDSRIIETSSDMDRNSGLAIRPVLNR